MKDDYFDVRGLLCYSERDFIKVMKNHNWMTEDDLPKNVAIISIIGTEECRNFYLQEDSEHYFKKENDRILNLDFDDLEEDTEWEGHLFKAMTEEQAKKSVEFIKKNVGKDFFIHCRAGKSRSQAFVQFILDCFPGIYHPRLSLNMHNPCLTPNIDVLSKLKRQMWLDKGE